MLDLILLSSSEKLINSIRIAIFHSDWYLLFIPTIKLKDEKKVMWEIYFKLRAADRSEPFRFLVNPINELDRKFPNIPKDKFLRALRIHSEEKKYSLKTGSLTDLKFKHTSEFHENQEIHIVMLVMEKIGPIPLIFRQTFEYLVLEGIDAHYNYLGSEALLNVLVQIIKPDSPTVKGLGKIITIYHASNIVELTRKESLVSFLDSIEGQILVFSLSIIIPTILIIILPLEFLDSMLGYVFSLGFLAITWCIVPLAKRSTRHAPLALVSILISYLITEVLINLQILVGGINPWGIFSNISRQRLLETLQSQELISGLGRQVFFGLELIQAIVPFLDVIIVAFIPFTVGVGLAGVFEKFDINWKPRIALKVIFSVFFLIFILVIPLGYHAFGKGSEGTLHASIGLVETAEMFSTKYIEGLNSEVILEELRELIASAQEHLAKAGNSFAQFGENPLIAYILPLLIPEVGGIPLEDLPEILTLTAVLADTIPYFPNILWGYNNLQSGFNQSFDILLQTIRRVQGGSGAGISQDYNTTMLEALEILQLGANNFSIVENPILNLISEVQEKLDYSVFAEISNLLTELEIGLPILITIINGSVPWINSTYKLTLMLEEIYDFNFTSNILVEAERDFNTSMVIQTVDVEQIPEETLLPIRDLVNFSLNLQQVTQYMLFSVHNSTILFQALNNTLSQIQSIDFSNSTNIEDPRWDVIDFGLQNTSDHLVTTRSSLDNMTTLIESQDVLEFQELGGLNQLLEDLGSFTESTSDRFDVIEQYVSALNGTLQAAKYFSLGSKAFNETLKVAIGTGQLTDFNATNALNNFTLCQESANATYDVLENVSDHLLNEVAITNWQHLVKGNISDSEFNSIYMNAQRCIDLISDTTSGQKTFQEVEVSLKDILDKMEQLDEDWAIFTF